MTMLSTSLWVQETSKTYEYSFERALVKFDKQCSISFPKIPIKIIQASKSESGFEIEELSFPAEKQQQLPIFWRKYP